MRQGKNLRCRDEKKKVIGLPREKSEKEYKKKAGPGGK